MDIRNSSLVRGLLVRLVRALCLPYPFGRRVRDEVQNASNRIPLTLYPSPSGEGHGALARVLYKGFFCKTLLSIGLILVMWSVTVLDSSAQQPMSQGKSKKGISGDFSRNIYTR